MTADVENLILQQLRDMRRKMDLLGENVADLCKGMDAGLSDLTQRVDGILTMPAGDVHHIDKRVEALEGKIK